MLNLYGFMCQRILKLSGYSKSLACRAKSLWPYMVLQWWIIRWQTQHVRNLCSPSSVLKVKPAKMNLCSQSVLFKALSVGKLLLYCRAMICFVPIRYFTDLFESVCVCVRLFPGDKLLKWSRDTYCRPSVHSNHSLPFFLLSGRFPASHLWWQVMHAVSLIFIAKFLTLESSIHHLRFLSHTVRATVATLEIWNADTLTLGGASHAGFSGSESLCFAAVCVGMCLY